MNATGLSDKARFYAEEALFAVRASRSLAGFRELMAETARFHWSNLRRTTTAPKAFRYDFRFGGTPVSMTLRSHTGDITIFYEVFCREAYRLDRDRIDPAKVTAIVDAGANIGTSSLYFATRYPDARVIAVEPNPDNFAMLVANTAAEPRITPVQACITGLPGQEVFIGTSGPGWGHQMNTTGEGVKVRGMSLAELMGERRLDRIDLLKIDIEGAEREVFANPDFLERTGVIIAEIHPPYDLAGFNRDLAAHGLSAVESPYARDPMVVIATRHPAT